MAINKLRSRIPKDAGAPVKTKTQIGLDPPLLSRPLRLYSRAKERSMRFTKPLSHRLALCIRENERLPYMIVFT